MRYAMWGDVKYPAGFTHFDYVNPDAPKGGEMRLVPPTSATPPSTSSTRSRSRAARRPTSATLMFERLLTGSLDEPASGYGLLAEDVEVAPDRMSAHLPAATRRRASTTARRCWPPT